MDKKENNEKESKNILNYSFEDLDINELVFIDS